MKEDSGDLWTYEAEYRCVTTNGVLDRRDRLVMGAGVARQAKERFPILPGYLGFLVQKHGNFPHICKQEGIISFPTKHHWRDDSSLSLIVCSAHGLVALVNEHNIKSVVMTRPGCGNGRLKWAKVKAEIEGILDDRFTVLTGE